MDEDKTSSVAPGSCNDKGSGNLMDLIKLPTKYLIVGALEYDELFHLLVVCLLFQTKTGMECEHVWRFWEI